MKKSLTLLFLSAFLLGCSAVQHRDPKWDPHPSSVEKLHRCTVSDQRGMTWTRTGSDVDEACHRAILGCRHSYGNLHHKHRPSICQRVKYQ